MTDVVARAREFLSEVHDARCPNCSHELLGPDDYRELMVELVTHVERLHSWDGLMSLLDEHWPEDIFPTLDDTDKRDPGPRIVSLIRTVDRALETIRADITTKLAETRRRLGNGYLNDSNFNSGRCDGLSAALAVIERAGIEP